MLTQQTIQQLRALRLEGMARALEEQLTQPPAAELSFEDRVAMLVQREIDWRDTKRVKRILTNAHLKFPGACIEDLDTRATRTLDRRQILSLAGCEWVRAGQTVIATGRTGLGKTWIACALANQAARQGFSVLYTRFARLLEELRIAHGDGTFPRRLAAIAKIDMLLIDDWAIAPISQTERTDLLELLDDRTTGKATLIATQLPVDKWHAYFNDPTLADAILDRVVHNSHRIKLDGDSLRKDPPPKRTKT